MYKQLVQETVQRTVQEKVQRKGHNNYVVLLMKQFVLTKSV